MRGVGAVECKFAAYRLRRGECGRCDRNLTVRRIEGDPIVGGGVVAVRGVEFRAAAEDDGIRLIIIFDDAVAEVEACLFCARRREGVGGRIAARAREFCVADGNGTVQLSNRVSRVIAACNREGCARRLCTFCRVEECARGDRDVVVACAYAADREAGSLPIVGNCGRRVCVEFDSARERDVMETRRLIRELACAVGDEAGVIRAVALVGVIVDAAFG